MNSNRLTFWPLLLSVSFIFAQSAKAEGLSHSWAPAKKEAIGTSFEDSTGTPPRSPVWFTVTEGVLSEVFYPRADIAQLGDLQFIVTSEVTDTRPAPYFSEQRRDTRYTVQFGEGDQTSVQISGESKDRYYRYEQTLVTDPNQSALRIRTRIIWNTPLRKANKRVFVLMNPALRNTGSNDRAWAQTNALIAEERRSANESFPAAALALMSNRPWINSSVGWVGKNDGWQQLSRHGQLIEKNTYLGPGNLALTGELEVTAGSEFEFELSLGFGTTAKTAQEVAKTSLQTPFQKVLQQYNDGWRTYLNRLALTDSSAQRLLQDEFFKKSALTLKMHEDKTHRGALVASLSKPGIPDSERAGEATGGYHLVWPRDLYHSALGLLASGDRITPVDVLRYLAKTQKEDGSWSQNYWIDGEPYWKGLQLDEVAFPVLLAGRLKQEGLLENADLQRTADLLVRKATSFILRNGPYSPQDRWEEIGGYIPSTLAAQVAALWTSGAWLRSDLILGTARQWDGEIERWTSAPVGSPYGASYYMRSSPSGSPSLDEILNLANGAGPARANEIIDGGFLELVRLGIRSPFHGHVQRTLTIYDEVAPEVTAPSDVQVQGAHATAHRRYNRDFYGENRVGGFWPLLAGERGMFALIQGDIPRAKAQLNLMMAQALPSGMIPEQTETALSSTWIPSGVACPLAWAHAEALILARSIQEGTPFDQPEFSHKKAHFESFAK